jgi:hypothetical protein
MDGAIKSSCFLASAAVGIILQAWPAQAQVPPLGPPAFFHQPLYLPPAPPRPLIPADLIFAGSTLPAPPQQTQPWTPPPTSLSPTVVSAFTALFNDGLADPRGCDYREIGVVAGTSWGDYKVVKTHGWLLPSPDPQHFAVCWSGLVYPVVSVGPPADLSKDVQDQLKQDQATIDAGRAQYEQIEQRTKNAAAQTGQPYQPSPFPWMRSEFGSPDEATNVAFDSLQPIQAALLFRLGHVDLAESLWNQRLIGRNNTDGKDPYLPLAYDWAWALFDRALCAHVRGDDHLALLSAQALASIQPAVETEAAARNIPRPSSVYNNALPLPYLGFLGQLPDLIADETNRTQEAPYTPVTQQPHPPQGPGRISQLIRDLELVSARDSDGGFISFEADPTVQALINSGDDAVEPLLNCLQNDPRLTRTTMLGKVFGVDAAASAALTGILQTVAFDLQITDLETFDMKRRKALADQIRAYWQKYKGLSLPDRWYGTLADDNATPQQWIDAGQNIIQDSDFAMQNPSPNHHMNGESLRAKTNPSVSDLLLKRMQDLSAPMNRIPNANLDAKTQLGMILAKWDGNAHLDDLRKLTGVLKNEATNRYETGDSAVMPVLSAYNARIRAGDTQAVADYAAWIVTLPRDGLNLRTIPLFQILWRHPGDPAIQKAAQKLFADPDSPWVPLVKKGAGDIDNIFDSPLIGLAGFRVELLRGLNDKTPAGSMTLPPGGGENIDLDGIGSSGRGGAVNKDPLAPPVGTPVRFRFCDYYAWQISRVKGAPRCRLYWPEAKRDEAVAACRAFLQKDGDLYQYQPPATPESDDEDAWIFRPDRPHRQNPPVNSASAALPSADTGAAIPSAPVAPPAAPSTPLPPVTGQPWTNSLGVKFVPAGTDGVLFSVWDVRVKDYTAFATATGHDLHKADFTQTPNDPIAYVSWDDAKAFCQWLTKKEQAQGRLAPNQQYRLPTDAEWSKAVGLNESGDGAPKDKQGKIKDVYPWGAQWPPPPTSGNYAQVLTHSDYTNTLPGGNGYAATAPVGTFAANQYGLYDMGGNVWQWCEDKYDPKHEERVLRGASWQDIYPRTLLSSSRTYGPPDLRLFTYGFRVVVVVSPDSK